MLVLNQTSIERPQFRHTTNQAALSLLQEETHDVDGKLHFAIPNQLCARES